MKARYIGGESEPGSRSTKLFGVTVYCDQIFDVPPAFENKARINPYVEVIDEKAPAPVAEVVEPVKPVRKKKADAE